MSRIVFLCLIATSSLAEASPENHWMPHGRGYQAVFFAVLEGAYRDGLSNEHLEIILTRNDPATYQYFIYACPLCSPTAAALEAYRSRPDRLYSFKGDLSHFGFGVPPDIAFFLESEKESNRLAGIQMLIRKWIEAYADSRNLDAAAREEWRARIEAAAGEGERILEGYRRSGSAHLMAPAFADSGECAVCTGASGGAMSASGWFGARQPIP